MQIPLTLSGKQFLRGLGQRARQPASRGAHRELLNCSRTFLGPQRLYGACDPTDAVHGAFGRCGAQNDKGVARLVIAFFAAPESCSRSILQSRSREVPLSTRRDAPQKHGPQRQPMPVAGVARAAPTSRCCHRCVPLSDATVSFAMLCYARLCRAVHMASHLDDKRLPVVDSAG